MYTIPTLALAAALTAGTGQTAPVSAPPSAPDLDRPRVVLVTLGPGPAVWERFGHNALWIHDPVAGTDIAYHYGLFDMSEEGFLPNFLRGRMFYSMGSADALRLVDAYRRIGRDIWVQELRLTPYQIRQLQTFFAWNLQPENRVYRYDYFRDNCSTRIRDALDRVLHSAVQEALDSIPSPTTFRDQAIALTSQDALLTTAMDLGLGPLSDRPISRWDLAFIPMRLRDEIQRVTIMGDEGPMPLVASTRRLQPLDAPQEEAAGGAPATPSRDRPLWLLIIGLMVAAGFAGLGRVAGRASGTGAAMGRVVLGVAGAVWGLVAGLLGLVLLALWTLTDHEFAWRNENLLQADPLALALVVLVPLAAMHRGSAAATRVAGVLAALAGAGLVLHFLPVTPQDNLPIIGLILPIHFGVYYALRQLGRAPR